MEVSPFSSDLSPLLLPKHPTHVSLFLGWIFYSNDQFVYARANATRLNNYNYIYISVNNYNFIYIYIKLFISSC